MEEKKEKKVLVEESPTLTNVTKARTELCLFYNLELS